MTARREANGPGTLIVDSNNGPPGRGFAYWRDLRQSAPFLMLETSVPSGWEEDYRARMEIRRIGETAAWSFSGSRQRLDRPAAQVAAQPTGAMLLVSTNRGAYEQTFDRHRFFSEPQVGDIAIYDGDMPFSVDVLADTTAIHVIIPHEKFRPYLGTTSGMTPTLIRESAGLHDMLATCFRIYASLRDPSPATAASSLDLLVHLIAMTRGLHPSDREDLAQSLAEARRRKALIFARARLHDPRLSLQAIADHLEISLRALHALFESTAEGIAGRITAMRLDRARDLLIRLPDRPIPEIARMCGFDNLATFYRNFARRHGVPPGEHRKDAFR